MSLRFSRHSLFATDVAVTIRRAAVRDGEKLRRLAALDEAVVPAGDLLVAEVADELWCALALDSGEAIADPFRPTGSLLEVLRLRADALRRARAGQLRAAHAPAWRRLLIPRRAR